MLPAQMHTVDLRSTKFIGFTFDFLQETASHKGCYENTIEEILT